MGGKGGELLTTSFRTTSWGLFDSPHYWFLGLFCGQRRDRSPKHWFFVTLLWVCSFQFLSGCFNGIKYRNRCAHSRHRDFRSLKSPSKYSLFICSITLLFLLPKTLFGSCIIYFSAVKGVAFHGGTCAMDISESVQKGPYYRAALGESF